MRGGRLIGHDSDADLGYVSDHTHPVDVVRESFRLQRALADMGYRISRYSGAAFKVDVVEADGSVRGLDVFGGFLADGNLHLMGEIRTPFRREWIFPLGTTTLEGRELPAPANTDEFLTATYGPQLAGARPGVQVRDAGRPRTAGSTAGSAAPASSASAGTAPTPGVPADAAGHRAVAVRAVGARAQEGGVPAAGRRHRLRPRRRRPLVRPAGRAACSGSTTRSAAASRSPGSPPTRTSTWSSGR